MNIQYNHCFLMSCIHSRKHKRECVCVCVFVCACVCVHALAAGNLKRIEIPVQPLSAVFTSGEPWKCNESLFHNWTLRTFIKYRSVHYIFMFQLVPDGKEKPSLLVCACVCVCLYVKMLTVSSGSHKLWPPCCGISWGWRWSCHQSRALRWRGAVWAHNKAWGPSPGW